MVDNLTFYNEIFLHNANKEKNEGAKKRNVRNTFKILNLVYIFFFM